MKSPQAQRYPYTRDRYTVHDTTNNPAQPLSSVGNRVTFKSFITTGSFGAGQHPTYSAHSSHTFDYDGYKWLKVLEWRGGAPINGRYPRLLIESAYVLFGSDIHPDGGKGDLGSQIEFSLTSFNNALDDHGVPIYRGEGTALNPCAIQLTNTVSPTHERLILDGSDLDSGRNHLAIDVYNASPDSISQGRFCLVINALEV